MFVRGSWVIIGYDTFKNYFYEILTKLTIIITKVKGNLLEQHIEVNTNKIVIKIFTRQYNYTNRASWTGPKNFYFLYIHT